MVMGYLDEFYLALPVSLRVTLFKARIHQGLSHRPCSQRGLLLREEKEQNSVSEYRLSPQESQLRF